jgi:putative heme-binding domain-containing protein
MTDDELFNVIRRGVPGTAMPAFPFPDTTIWQISSYLRSLSTPAFLVPVAGDVQAGAEVYRRASCGSCHMIYGKGGYLGPDLTDVAASRTVKQLREAIVKPSDHPVDGFKGVSVLLTNGEKISGIAKNYSDYSIDILDPNGALHLLSISQVRETHFRDKSLMPDSYGHSLSARDLQNLIAFLSRQAVRPDARPDQKLSHREEH